MHWGTRIASVLVVVSAGCGAAQVTWAGARPHATSHDPRAVELVRAASDARSADDLDATLAALEQAMALDASDAAGWLALARARLDDGYLRAELASDDVRARSAYAAAREAAELGLDEVAPRFADVARREGRLDVDALPDTPVASELLLVRAIAVLRLARLDGLSALLAHADEIRRSLEHVAGRSTFEADLGLGELEALVPTYGGGDLERSRQRFEAALATTDSLDARVRFALDYAVRAGDRARFRALLEVVRASAATSLVDRSAHERAARALRDEEDLFR